MAGPVVATKGLQKDFGSLRALGPVTVSIPTGAWGLLGPNGAGKTTLIRLLLGLTPASAGSAAVLGRDPSTQSKEIRQRIGFVPERDSYVPGLTGVRYVAYAGRLNGLPAADAKQRAHEALNFVGLDESRYRDVASFSQGMRQRAKLAQAIVHDPQLLFLDEPTNGLDPEGREEMLALIKDLAHSHGIAVILATHILPEVEAVCDGALVLDRGRVISNASLHDLSAARRETFIVRVRGQDEAFQSALLGEGARAERTNEGLLLVTLPPGGTARSILACADAAGVQVRHLAPARASLEEALVTALQEGGAA